MILDCSSSRDSLPPGFVTLLLDIILCALFAACPTSSLVIVYSIGLSLLSLRPLYNSCLFDFDTVLIKLQMDPHTSDPSLQKTSPPTHLAAFHHLSTEVTTQSLHVGVTLTTSMTHLAHGGACKDAAGYTPHQSANVPPPVPPQPS